MVKSKENLWGAYAFLIGVVLAVTLGLLNLNDTLEYAGGLFYTALILIGLIVGFANTSDRDTQTFLIASLAIVIVGALGVDALKYITTQNSVVNLLRNVLGSLSLLFIPATIVVALKTVFSMAKI
jgi:hypothetical protein